MPPVRFPVPCTTFAPYNSTINESQALELAKDDRNALLYIVVTLLFYSMGIIIGIITYLKRERREMLEDKTFDLYFQMKSDPYTTFKAERVQMVAARLAQLEKDKLEKEILMSSEAGCSNGIQNQTSLEVNQSESSDCESIPTVASKSSPTMSSSSGNNTRPTDIDITKQTISENEINVSGDEIKSKIESVSDAEPAEPASDPAGSGGGAAAIAIKTEIPLKPGLGPTDNQRRTVFQVSPSGEPISSVVAKIFDSERRGGLMMSPKALHLFDRGKKRLVGRQLSLDVPDRRVTPRLKTRQLSMDIPDTEMVPNLFSEVEKDRLLSEIQRDEIPEETSEDSLVSRV
ncbi:uncharacterized protein LOC126817222 [Patella vulgata]|uniref:uncharacterized protein LOC126817222 n=1 Tax=Patella vulgata TaxID=6465 RepID=UPI0021805A7F|nr:uncharacterized protein LOC126817222 [Patella vulgata]XP_050399990.1 uncharacterized protein LOC126817222 [Patella vulgata]XP_050399991.1 uncharacterized protein LOC126817222 [Patella vulgata]